MKKLIDVLFKILIFLFFPLLFSLIFWYVSIPFIKEKYIFIFLILGLFVGLFINFFILKKYLKNLYNLDIKFLIIIYLFYNFCIYVFFMGVPIFNLIINFISGLYFSRKCNYLNLKKTDSYRIIKSVSIFTTIFIFIIFCISGIIAIKDSWTGLNIQGMLHLKNPITKSQIYYIVIFGELLFLILNYYLTFLISFLTYKKLI